MLDFLTALLAAICFAPLLFGYWRARPESVVLWVLGLFSFGHFVLPLIFRDLTALRLIEDDALIGVVFMALLFLAAVMAGAVFSHHLFKAKPRLELRRGVWDRILFSRPRVTFYASFAVYLAYVLNSTLTVYQAGGVANFIADYRPIDAIIAFVGNMAIALMAIVFARSLHARTWVENFVNLALYFSPIIILLATAQRTAVLLPFIYLATAISLSGRTRLAFNATICGLALIVVLSPLLVFFRQVSTVAQGLNVEGAASQFSFGADASSTMLASILDRADALYNMALIVSNFDYVGFANDQYFYSIIAKFVPGLFWGEKPIALSTNGMVDGHLSVIAWHIIVGPDSIGSLTIFGAITAFREGGWIWMAINGFLTGCAYTLIFRHFGEREEWRRIFYIVIFPSLCVQRVPPSFFEILTSLSAVFYVYLAMAIAERMIGRPTALRVRAPDSRRICLDKDTLKFGHGERRVGGWSRRA